MSWRAELQASVGPLSLDVHLDGARGPLVLAGPNGAGKTTVLKLLMGARPPDSGQIILGDQTVLDTATGVQVPIEARGVGYVPQGDGLFPHLSAIDNVAFGLAHGPTSLSRANQRAQAMALLDDLSLTSLAHRRPAKLSGGERQRVALARALIIKPRLLLLDEPLSALDAVTRRQTRQLLAQHLADGPPALIVTHDVRDAVAFGAEVAMLIGGRIVQRGSVAELRQAPAHPFVAEWVGD